MAMERHNDALPLAAMTGRGFDFGGPSRQPIAWFLLGTSFDDRLKVRGVDPATSFLTATLANIMSHRIHQHMEAMEMDTYLFDLVKK
jgi:hypothetical protein